MNRIRKAIVLALILLAGLLGVTSSARSYDPQSESSTPAQDASIETPGRASFHVAWITVVGQVASKPTTLNGTGDWEVLGETGDSYRINVAEPEIFAGSIPTVGQSVLVEGFQLPNGDISAIRFAPSSVPSSPEPEERALFQFSGQVTEISELAQGASWSIRSTANGASVNYPVFVDEETAYYPRVPEIGDWVHVIAVENVAEDVAEDEPEDETWPAGYRAIEIALDTYAAGEIVARLETGVLSTTIASRYNLIPQETILVSGEIHRFLSTNPMGFHLAGLIERMTLDPDIIWVEFNQIGTVPLEGHPHSTWGWGGTEPSEYINAQVMRQINLLHAHEKVRGEDVVIAVLDTGVDLAHPALQDHLLPGWDMIDDDALPLDEGGGIARGHGTHVAGIAVRIAPESYILPVRVLDSDGRGDMFVLAYAIDWAVAHGADVINLSLGSAENSWVLSDAILAAMAQDVVVVAAAGNDDSDAPRFPAAQPGVIGVTAVDGRGQKADFANYGNWVSLAAPGVGITSTIVGPAGSGYATWSGTSMATPFVSGASALLRQHNPDFSAVQTSAWLVHHSAELSTLDPLYADELGGLLNVDDSLTRQPIRRTLYMPVVRRE